MTKLIKPSELLRRIEFLEGAVQELNPGLTFPDYPPEPPMPTLTEIREGIGISSSHLNDYFKGLSLEEAVKEIKKRIVKPSELLHRDPTTTEETKRRVKYLVFSATIGQAYDWATDHQVNSLDWIRVQGDQAEGELIHRLHKAKTHCFQAVELGDWRENEILASFYLTLEQDGYIRNY